MKSARIKHYPVECIGLKHNHYGLVGNRPFTHINNAKTNEGKLVTQFFKLSFVASVTIMQTGTRLD
jgi:hypothetical protein